MQRIYIVFNRKAAASRWRIDNLVGCVAECQHGTPEAAWALASNHDRDAAEQVIVPAYTTGRTTQHGAPEFFLCWSEAIDPQSLDFVIADARARCDEWGMFR